MSELSPALLRLIDALAVSEVEGYMTAEPIRIPLLGRAS